MTKANKQKKIRSLEGIYFNYEKLEEVLSKRNITSYDYSREELRALLTPKEFSEIHTDDLGLILENFDFLILGLQKQGVFTKEESGTANDGYSIGFVEEVLDINKKLLNVYLELFAHIKDEQMQHLFKLFSLRLFKHGMSAKEIEFGPLTDQAIKSRVHRAHSKDRVDSKLALNYLLDVYDEYRAKGKVRFNATFSRDVEIHQVMTEFCELNGIKYENGFTEDAWCERIGAWLKKHRPKKK